MRTEISPGKFLIKTDSLTQLENRLIQASQTVHWKMPFTLLNLEFNKNNTLLQAWAPGLNKYCCVSHKGCIMMYQVISQFLSTLLLIFATKYAFTAKTAHMKTFTDK